MSKLEMGKVIIQTIYLKTPLTPQAHYYSPEPPTRTFPEFYQHPAEFV